MRGFLIFVGLLLLLGGGAVAGLRYAPIELSAFQVMDSVPGSREFLMSENAIYAGGGIASFGLLLMIVVVATGGKRERVVIKQPSIAPARPSPRKTKGQTVNASVEAAAAPQPTPATVAPPTFRQPAAPPIFRPAPAPEPLAMPTTSQPVEPPRPPPPVTAGTTSQSAPVPAPPSVTVEPALQPARAPTPQPVATEPAFRQATATVLAEVPKAKPQASSQPPADAGLSGSTIGGPPPDPRMINRKRVQDLVTINDAVKAYYAKNGAYPKAEGLAGANERGAAWIPGLSPDFLPSLPRDPLHNGATQYVYVSDGANYKLLAQGASLVGSGNVEVLGIKIDQTRNPTQQNASYGFWTPAFATV